MDFVKSVVDKLHIYRHAAMLHEISLPVVWMWSNSGEQ